MMAGYNKWDEERREHDLINRSYAQGVIGEFEYHRRLQALNSRVDPGDAPPERRGNGRYCEPEMEDWRGNSDNYPEW